MNTVVKKILVLIKGMCTLYLCKTVVVKSVNLN